MGIIITEPQNYFSGYRTYGTVPTQVWLSILMDWILTVYVCLLKYPLPVEQVTV